MRILVDGLSSNRGGIGNLILNIANMGQKENEIEFSFLVPENSVYKEELAEKGFDFFVVPSLTKTISYIRTIKDIFKRKKYDYVWINNSSKVNIILPLIAKKEGNAKIITHSHGVDNEEQGIKKCIFSFAEKLFEKKFNSLISVPLACSEAAADYFYKGTDLRKKAIIIKNGISSDSFIFSEEIRKSQRKNLGFSTEDIVLIASGRFTGVKNYEFLIDLMNELPIKYKLIIAGDGEEKNKLESLTSALKLSDRVYFPGCVNNIADYLFASDIYLMPSLYEGMPFAAIEAQASGLPCILSDTISKEIDISQNVIFCTLNDKNEWKNEILKISYPNKNRIFYNDLVIKSGFSIETSYDAFVNSLNNF